MNNTNQQLYTIYSNIQKFYVYRRLISLDALQTQDEFITQIQKNKYVILSSVNIADVVDANGAVDESKVGLIRQEIEGHNEKSKQLTTIITNIILVYPGTECEGKRASMTKLINHIRYPRANIVIITPVKVTSAVIRWLYSLNASKEHKYHDFKSYTYTLLNSVIPEYELAPKYDILTAEQINQLKTWFIEADALPKVFDTDPQMVWIGASVGDVVKFTYLSEVTIEAVGYCVVIPSTQ
jgi:DNA-directed RNA polymerase subunit H (RpoH/RPB5)